jgi:hypothetical protein
MANNVEYEEDIVYDVHDDKGKKLGRGVFTHINYCNNEARAPENCFNFTHFVMEDGTKVRRTKFTVKEHELKGKGTERSTEAHKAAFGAAGGRRRKTRKGRKAHKGRKASRRNCRR